MKRAISLILVILMALSLAACKNTPGTPNTPDPTAKPAETEASASAPTEAPEATEPADETPAPETTDEPTPAPTAMPERPQEDGSLPKVYEGKDVFFVSKPDGSLWAWGKNDRGQLGLGDTDDRAEPQLVGWGLTPVIVGETVFALSSDGVLWGWGRNDLAQLGTGDTEDRTRPAELMYSVKQVYSAFGGFCALTEAGELYAWGISGDAKTADGPLEPRLQFENVEYYSDYCMIKDGGELWLRRGNWMKVAENVTRVFDKRGFICYAETSDGMLYSINDFNELVPVCDNVRDVGIDYRAAFVLKNDGSLWRWDAGAENDAADRLSYVMNEVVEIQCGWDYDESWGYDYNFALKANGDLWAWSWEYENAVVGKPEDSKGTDPELVANNVKKVFTNNVQTFIIKNDGSVWATGQSGGTNEFGIFVGALGDGAEETRYGFVKLGLEDIGAVTSLLTVIYDELGEDDEGSPGVQLYARTFAVDNKGRVYAWGWNGDGLLGVGTGDGVVYSPVEVRFE